MCSSILSVSGVKSLVLFNIFSYILQYFNQYSVSFSHVEVKGKPSGSMLTFVILIHKGTSNL